MVYSVWKLPASGPPPSTGVVPGGALTECYADTLSSPVTYCYCYDGAAYVVTGEGESELEGVAGIEVNWSLVNGDCSTRSGSVADN